MYIYTLILKLNKMANTKVHSSKKKKTKSFAITQKVLDEFIEHCKIENLVPSRVVEGFIVEFNNKQ